MGDGAGPRGEQHKADVKSWWRGYVQSDLDTKMLVSLRSTDTTAQMKAKIESAHFTNFPSLGRVKVEKLLISAFGDWWSFDAGECDSFSCADSLFKVELIRLEDEAPQNSDRIGDQPMKNVVDGQRKALVLPSPDEAAIPPSSELLEKVKVPSSTLTKKQETPGAAQASNGPENHGVEAQNVASRPDFASRAVVVSDLIGQILSPVQKSNTEVGENGKAEEKFDNKRTAFAADLQDRSEEVKKVKVGGAEEEQEPAGLTQETESVKDDDSAEERDAKVDRVLIQHFPESSTSDRTDKEADDADATSKEIASESQRMGNSKNDPDSDDELDPTEEEIEGDELPGAVTDSVPLKDEATTKLGTGTEDSDSEEQSGEGVPSEQSVHDSLNEETAPLIPKAVSESSPQSLEDSAGCWHDNKTPGPAPLDPKTVSESSPESSEDGAGCRHDNPDKETPGPAPLHPKAISESSPESSEDSAGCRHDNPYKETPGPAPLDPKATSESSSEASEEHGGCRPLSQRPLSQPTNSSEEEKESGLARLSRHAVLLGQASPSSSGSSGQSGQGNATATVTQTQQQEESALGRLSRHAEKALLTQASSTQTQRKFSVKSTSDDGRADQKEEAEAQKDAGHRASGFSNKRATRGLVVESEHQSNRGSGSGASSGSSSSVSSEETGGSEWKTSVARSRRIIDSRNQHFVEDKNGLSKLLTGYKLKRRKSPEGKNKDKQATEEARRVQTPEREVKAGKSSEAEPEPVAENLKKDEKAPNKSQLTKSIDSQQSGGKARRDRKSIDSQQSGAKARRDRKNGTKGEVKQDEAVKGAIEGEKQGEEALKEDLGTATGGDESQKSNGIQKKEGSKSKNKSRDANKDGTGSKPEQQQSPKRPRKKKIPEVAESTDNQETEAAGAEVETKAGLQPSKRARKEKTTETRGAGKQKQVAPEPEVAQQTGAQKETAEVPERAEAEAEQQQSPKRSRRKKAVAAPSEGENSGQGNQGDDEEQTLKKRRRKKEETDGDEEAAPVPKKQKSPSRAAKAANLEKVTCPCGRSYVRKTSNYYNHIRSCETAISAGLDE